MFDRYQIVLGHYHYYLAHHGGQWSREYTRLCKILRYFRPGLSEQYASCLDKGENELAKEVYNNLVEKYQTKK